MRKSLYNGFTVIELIVVIALTVVLAAVFIPICNNFKQPKVDNPFVEQTQQLQQVSTSKPTMENIINYDTPRNKVR